MKTVKKKITSLMQKYWNKKISQEVLQAKYVGKFTKEDIAKALELAHSEKDVNSLESIFHIGFTFNLFDKETVPILCKYITECWHTRHEDIASLLQKLKEESSIESIVKAVHLNCECWHDNGDAFIRKCIYVLSHLNSKESLEQLRILSTDANEIIKKYAEKELSKKQ